MTTDERIAKLRQAAGLIFEVQYEMLTEDEKLPRDQRTEFWRNLYRLRIEIANECSRMERR